MTLRPLTMMIAFLVVTMTTSSAWAYINPNKGRFMQRDSVGYVDGPNVYQYVRSQPTRWVDPSGERAGRPVQHIRPTVGGGMGGSFGRGMMAPSRPGDGGFGPGVARPRPQPAPQKPLTGPHSGMPTPQPAPPGGFKPLGPKPGPVGPQQVPLGMPPDGQTVPGITPLPPGLDPIDPLTGIPLTMGRRGEDWVNPEDYDCPEDCIDECDRLYEEIGRTECNNLRTNEQKRLCWDRVFSQADVCRRHCEGR